MMNRTKERKLPPVGAGAALVLLLALLPALLSAAGGAYEGNEAYLPRSGYEKDEMFHDNETLRKELSELWIKVKLHE